MIFNSFEFLVFLPVVWAAYWLLGRRLRLQNLLVVVASYVFYGWWDWRFLVLIAFTSAWSYLVGLLELRRWDARPSRFLLTVSLAVNRGLQYIDLFQERFDAGQWHDCNHLASEGARGLTAMVRQRIFGWKGTEWKRVSK